MLAWLWRIPPPPLRCVLLQQLLLDDPHLKHPWQSAVQWLQTEMERVRAGEVWGGEGGGGGGRSEGGGEREVL